jgi:hypothetical protein
MLFDQVLVSDLSDTHESRLEAFTRKRRTLLALRASRVLKKTVI